jgi:hypothetical protein
MVNPLPLRHAPNEPVKLPRVQHGLPPGVSAILPIRGRGGSWCGPTTHEYCESLRGLLLAVRRSVDHHELRAKIRHLIASGDLPTISPLASGSLSAPPGIRRISIERSLPDPCLICGEANPTVAYTYGNGRVVLLHAACDALWRQEREAEA